MHYARISHLGPVRMCRNRWDLGWVRFYFRNPFGSLVFSPSIPTVSSQSLSGACKFIGTFLFSQTQFFFSYADKFSRLSLFPQSQLWREICAGNSRAKERRKLERKKELLPPVFSAMTREGTVVAGTSSSHGFLLNFD